VLSPDVGRPPHPVVDVQRPIRSTPIPHSRFSPSGDRTYARNAYAKAYVKFLRRDTRGSPHHCCLMGPFAGPRVPPPLFRPAGPVIRARIIAITMNSRSYYASVTPPPKWRPGASYHARRTRSASAPLFIVAPALPAYRAMLYRSTINVENGGRPMVGIIDPVRTMTALLRCRVIRWVDILACFISRIELECISGR